MDKRLDLLNREESVENVIKIVNQLSEIKRGCCFAIEGGWGVGKTFVIEEIEERLKGFQSEETNSDRYFVFHYICCNMIIMKSLRLRLYQRCWLRSRKMKHFLVKILIIQ